MVNRRRCRPDVYLEYAFDRLLARKLERAYEILVPDQVRRTGTISGISDGEGNEDSSHLRPSVFGQAKRRQDDRQPDSDPGFIRERRRLHRAH